MNLSAHVTLAEFTHSPTATLKKINQTMPFEAVAFAKDLCENVFEPIRAHVGRPIKINSGYRSKLLNKAVGGSPTSQHVTGQAMDLDLHDRDLFEWIIDNIEFDQLIYEFGDDQNAGWFHISYVKGHNRKDVRRAIKVNGAKKYPAYKRK